MTSHFKIRQGQETIKVMNIKHKKMKNAIIQLTKSDNKKNIKINELETNLNNFIIENKSLEEIKNHENLLLQNRVKTLENFNENIHVSDYLQIINNRIDKNNTKDKENNDKDSDKDIENNKDTVINDFSDIYKKLDSIINTNLIKSQALDIKINTLENTMKDIIVNNIPTYVSSIMHDLEIKNTNIVNEINKKIQENKEIIYGVYTKIINEIETKNAETIKQNTKIINEIETKNKQNTDNIDEKIDKSVNTCINIGMESLNKDVEKIENIINNKLQIIEKDLNEFLTEKIENLETNNISISDKINFLLESDKQKINDICNDNIHCEKIIALENQIKELFNKNIITTDIIEAILFNMKIISAHVLELKGNKSGSRSIKNNLMQIT